jgi:hypothetical protein
VLVNGEVLCIPCARGAYYQDPQEITWPEMNWTPASSGLFRESRHERPPAQEVHVKETSMIRFHAEIPSH